MRRTFCYVCKLELIEKWQRDVKKTEMRRTISSTSTMARLTARIANADCPRILGRILTYGRIFALNKLNAEEQEERKEQGLGPKRRPVNVGCGLLKWSLKLALQTPQARAAIAKLGPLQMGMQAEHGNEVVGHLFRALWERGWLMPSTKLCIQHVLWD